ncbi:TIGR03557 family F420-dependent LLM class oxidoreductase [Marinitenerispora sediminis]|uniref:LLM class F420-dependent oxidoreductase n=1 Tax=Marinitenerispora sediminis TaxID=1931232 RepID=A0A368TDB5_9ACTN|nr:TIGR03557 family F420-dependent LLM class oxidoreductase [Marinitenerispora sediminis]RCV53381.1 LLM class F420-dependent oxidoreductase [Marinitenerispora sediminis]RCV58423.1 LLM class F420-dependent oxidoreductase [Marinitenerispora sediminis]RCV61796.1 LLM class F420-dependent oxidoreductase [Marinitenerispora sediminis]
MLRAIGYFLSSEEHGPRELIQQARLAEEAGFEALWISDHFHPWLDVQGHSPFVWSVVGAIGEATSLPVTTAVTCPTVRLHPAIVAQAAATSAALARGGFTLGVGTGEALNEHVLGDRWPPAAERREMLEEAVEVMRRLWTGRQVSHRGKHYTVDTARLYTLPDSPPKVFVSAFGEKAAELAGRVGDGLVTMGPDRDTIATFRENGGDGKPIQGGLKVCWGPDAAEARRYAARQWPNDALPGEASQLLPLPRHFQQLTDELITPEYLGTQMPCGPDADAYLRAIGEYVDAGVEEVYVGQVGHDQRGFFDFFSREVLPELRRRREPVGAVPGQAGR